MEQFITVFAVILLFLVISFAAMAIGLIIRGKKLTGGCGSHGGKKSKTESKSDGEHSSCGFCPEKKKLGICSSENKGALKDVSKLGMLGRYEK